MYPYSNFMTIDKNMVSYNGKICLKQYMKNKHKKFGIKIFSKASSFTGYCYQMIPYSGKGFLHNKKKDKVYQWLKCLQGNIKIQIYILLWIIIL